MKKHTVVAVISTVAMGFAAAGCASTQSTSTTATATPAAHVAHHKAHHKAQPVADDTARPALCNKIEGQWNKLKADATAEIVARVVPDMADISATLTSMDLPQDSTTMAQAGQQINEAVTSLNVAKMKAATDHLLKVSPGVKADVIAKCPALHSTP